MTGTRKFKSDAERRNVSQVWRNPRTGKELGLAQKIRYYRKGIKRGQYQSGKADLQAARGHKNEAGQARARRQRQREERAALQNANLSPERKLISPRSWDWIEYARNRAITDVLPYFETYSREQKRDVAYLYCVVFFGGPDGALTDFAPERVAAGVSNRALFTRYANLADFMRDEPGEHGEPGDIEIVDQSAQQEARGAYNRHIGFVLHGPGWTPPSRAA